ncbi:MAG: hypothetical protein JW990_10980 [Thermoleophilia bacterium]|nr:hypothetical protein [Thermoleophilia bacterium]
MNRLAIEAIKKAAPELRILIRKAAEAENENWLRANLPKTHSLPSPAVLAGQIVALRDGVLALLKLQAQRYIEYVREHPPALRPVAKDALSDLPPETAVTYHAWLEDVTLRREWWNQEERRFKVDTQELGALLREHLQEAIGTGGEAALRVAGSLPPGFASLGQKEAAGLLRQMSAFEHSIDVGARALYRALVDRAAGGAIQGAILRDGAGRPLAVATFRSVGKDLTVRYLGALDAAVPGSGVQMVRELAGLAASKGQGLALWASDGSEAVFGGLGFAREAGGRFALSAQSALELAQAPPGSSAAWTRAGWLEGPETFLSAGEAAEAQRVRKAGAGIPEELGGLEFGVGEVVLRDAAGRLLAVAKYELPKKGGDLVLVSLWVSPKAPPATGRQIVRELAAAAARHGRGMVARQPAGNVVGLYERLGMAKPGETYAFTPKEAAAFASGLTQSATFAGQLSWELAVAGASEYLEKDVIPGVIDDVTATTHQQLIDTLIQGLDRGEGTNDLIARIRALDDSTFGLARAERIARTEVITANRAGGYQIGREAGCTEHRWVSRLARNTRDWHREAHGQVKPYHEPFVVNNRTGQPEKLLFPGDRSLGAGPENVIQCVCSEDRLKPGVSNDAAYEEHGTAGTLTAPGPVVAAMPEEVGKRGRTRLQDLCDFVLKSKGWVPGPNAYWQRVSPEQETAPQVTRIPEPPQEWREMVIEWGDPAYPQAKLIVDAGVPEDVRDAVETGWRKAMQRQPRDVTVRLVEGLHDSAPDVREEDLVKIPAEYRSREDDIRVFAGTYDWMSENVEYQRYTPGPHHIMGRVPPPPNMSLIYEDLWEGTLVHEMGHDACDELLGDNMHITLNRMVTEAAGGREGLSNALQKIRENISCYGVHSGAECYAECYALRHSDAWKAGKVPGRIKRFVEAVLAGKLTAVELNDLTTKLGN